MTKIGKEAFVNCEKLRSVNVPNKRAIIDPYAGWSPSAFVKGHTFITQNEESPAESKSSIAQAVPQAVEVKNPAVVPSQSQPVLQQQSSPVMDVEQLVNVDQNIFVSKARDKNTFAVIIGNEKYVNDAGVPFAENDAKVFKEYVNKTLGVPEKQIRYVPNAGLNSLRMAVRWLTQAMEAFNGQGRAIFYYAGHGIPNEKDQSAYLLPVDGSGSDPESAYPLEKLYQELSKIPTRSVIIFLDACFSGAMRDGGMLASARGVAIKSRPTEPKGKLIVFTAAQGDETAYPFKSQKHGMFTYYLLRKLQETRGEATLGDLADYLCSEVKRESFIENNKMQTPSVNVSTPLQGSWRTMKLK